MSRTAQIVLLGTLLAVCVGSILFVVFSLDDLRRSPEEPREEWEEPIWRKRPSPRVEKPAEQPAPPPEEEKGPGEETATEEARDEEEVRNERGPSDEMAELALELIRPKEFENRLIVITVVDEGMAPMEDVLVVFRDGDQLVYRERTDEEGRVEYQPYDDEDGPFRVDAITPYYSPGTESDVKPGDTKRIELEAQPWIEGRVRAPSTGHGLVTLYMEYGQRTTKLEADGTFAFYGLDPGWYLVRAEVDPYGSDEVEFQLPAGTRQWVDLKVRLRKRVRIFGDINVWPRTGGKAWINGIEVPVSNRGRYIFEKAAIGLNEIVVDAEERPFFKRRFFVKGRQKSEYNFEFDSGGSIAGIVRTAKRRVRLQGAEVRVGLDPREPNNGGMPEYPIERVPLVYTNEKGEFEIKRLKRGVTYLVSVVKHPHGQYVGRFTAKTLGVHKIELPTGPFVFGRLKGLGGIPRDATVTARRLLEEPEARVFNISEWDVTRSKRDNDGYYGLSGLLPDVYLIRAEAPGFGSMETVVDLRDGFEGRMDLRIRKGQTDRVDDAELLTRLPPVIESGADVEPDERDDTTVLTIDAMRESHEVPFLGVYVRFFEGDAEYSAPMSFEQEKFDLVGLEEATYRAVLTHPSLKKPIIIDDIKLVRGEPLTIKLRERKD